MSIQADYYKNIRKKHIYAFGLRVLYGNTDRVP